MTAAISVFRVEFDVDRYQALLIDGNDSVFRRWRPVIELDGRLKADQWTPPPVYSHKPLLDLPDFWHLYGCAGIVATEKAMEIVEYLFLRAGELLPLPFKDSVLTVLNVTEVYDCIDPSNVVTRPSGAISEYAFLPHRLPESSLFKIPETSWVEVLCVEGVVPLEEGFRWLVESSGLQGLRFVELWRGYGGSETSGLR